MPTAVSDSHSCRETEGGWAVLPGGRMLHSGEEAVSLLQPVTPLQECGPPVSRSSTFSKEARNRKF